MNAGGGQGGQGGQSGQGGQAGGSPAQATTVYGITPTSGFTTSTTTRPSLTLTSSTSSASATSSSKSSAHAAINTNTIVIGVILGLTAMLAIGLVTAYMKGWAFPCTKKRKAKQDEIREQTLGAAALPWFSRMPSALPSTNGDQEHSAAPGVVPIRSHSTMDTTPSQPSPTEDRNSGDYFLPTYAQSQSGMSSGGRHNLFGLNTATHSASSVEVSPLTPREQEDIAFTSSQTDGAPFVFSQSTGYSGFSYLLPQTEGVLQRPALPLSRDTMGFPILVEPQNTPTTIVAPIPLRPLVHQESLERAVRRGMLNSSPNLQAPNRLVPGRWSLTSGESGVLGTQNPVRMMGSGLPLTHTAESDMARNLSQRSTASSVLSVVSDGELERLGVGSTAVRGPRR